MTKDEFSKFAMAIKTYYPKEEKLLPNSQAMALWYQELKDIPFPVAEAALRKWVQTSKWSPTIAEIREMAATVSMPEIPDWGEGWERTVRAIRKYGRYRQKEAMESLDPLTRKTVERLGFRELCASENPTADRANFRTIYEMLAKRKQTEQVVAIPLREVIGKLQLGHAEGFLQIGGGD